MATLKKLKQYLSGHFSHVKDSSPEEAYNLWANSYDSQPDNLMLALDEEIFFHLLSDIDIKNNIIVDIGCGTGRHWKKLLAGNPKKITGFDVSVEMLKLLNQKFPGVETYRLLNNKLPELKNESCDCVISTLTIAHIENVEEAITEWERVLKPGGHMIITDYHPLALAKGGRRTFVHLGQTVTVKNYVHTLDNLKSIAAQLGLQLFRSIEKVIDDSVKLYYEKQDALPVFEIWKGTPVIFGMHLIKSHAAP